MTTKWADPVLSSYPGRRQAFRARGLVQASDCRRVALGLLAVACLVGSGLGVACYGAAKQVPQTPPSTDVNRQTAPDLPSEPPKGDASVPIGPVYSR